MDISLIKVISILICLVSMGFSIPECVAECEALMKNDQGYREGILHARARVDSLLKELDKFKDIEKAVEYFPEEKTSKEEFRKEINRVKAKYNSCVDEFKLQSYEGEVGFYIFLGEKYKVFRTILRKKIRPANAQEVEAHYKKFGPGFSEDPSYFSRGGIYYEAMYLICYAKGAADYESFSKMFIKDPLLKFLSENCNYSKECDCKEEEGLLHKIKKLRNFSHDFYLKLFRWWHNDITINLDISLFYYTLNMSKSPQLIKEEKAKPFLLNEDIIWFVKLLQKYAKQDSSTQSRVKTISEICYNIHGKHILD